MIPFTRYIPPHGERLPDGIERPPHVEAFALDLYGRGFRFDVELLSMGMVSLTCMRSEVSDDCLAHQVVGNGPSVPEAVDRLVADAWTRALADAMGCYRGEE